MINQAFFFIAQVRICGAGNPRIPQDSVMEHSLEAGWMQNDSYGNKGIAIKNKQKK